MSSCLRAGWRVPPFVRSCRSCNSSQISTQIPSRGARRCTLRLSTASSPPFRHCMVDFQTHFAGVKIGPPFPPLYFPASALLLLPDHSRGDFFLPHLPRHTLAVASRAFPGWAARLRLRMQLKSPDCHDICAPTLLLIARFRLSRSLGSGYLPTSRLTDPDDPFFRYGLRTNVLPLLRKYSASSLKKAGVLRPSRRTNPLILDDPFIVRQPSLRFPLPHTWY